MKLIHSLAAISAIFISTPALALPSSWDPFIVCTKEFTVISRPGGHFETVVAERVTTKCYKLAPPSIGTPGEFGPIGPSPDPRSPEDIPCAKIPDAIKTLTKHKADLDAQTRALDASIAAGHDALSVVLDTGLTLSAQCAADNRACRMEQSAYQAKLQKKLAELKGVCSKVLAANRADCLDGVMDDAEISPPVAAARALRDAKCDQASDACGKAYESGQVANRLGEDLRMWTQQRMDLHKESVKTARTIGLLKSKQTSDECKKP